MPPTAITIPSSLREDMCSCSTAQLVSSTRTVFVWPRTCSQQHSSSSSASGHSKQHCGLPCWVVMYAAACLSCFCQDAVASAAAEHWLLEIAATMPSAPAATFPSLLLPPPLLLLLVVNVDHAGVVFSLSSLTVVGLSPAALAPPGRSRH